MDFENMRLQEGILLDKMKVNIGVKGICPGAGATFVSGWLDHYLNDKDRHRFFISSPEKYAVYDDPECMDEMDIIVAVIDPLPSLLIEGSANIGELREMKREVLWILNRDNKGVNRREMKRYLGFMPEFSQEEIPREIIARAEYNCEKLPSVMELKGIEALGDHIRSIMS